MSELNEQHFRILSIFGQPVVLAVVVLPVRPAFVILFLWVATIVAAFGLHVRDVIAARRSPLPRCEVKRG